MTIPLWRTRRQAEASLSHDLKPFADLIDEVFGAVDQAIDRLDAIDEPFGRVCAIVLVKSRNLALGCYSLSLDALAQEAGALFRPLIECLELLLYFRLDPSRVHEALNGELPKAGIIAQRIEGKFKGLREYLNMHASHLALSPEAMMHLFDVKAGRLRPVQVLRENLRTLLASLVWLAIEGVNCVSVGSAMGDHALADSVEDLKRRAFLLFDQADAQLELPRFRGHPRVGAERSVHDAEEPSTIPARVSGAAR